MKVIWKSFPLGIMVFFFFKSGKYDDKVHIPKRKRVGKFSGIKEEFSFLYVRSKVIQKNEETQNVIILVNDKRLEL